MYSNYLVTVDEVSDDGETSNDEMEQQSCSGQPPVNDQALGNDQNSDFDNDQNLNSGQEENVDDQNSVDERSNSDNERQDSNGKRSNCDDVTRASPKWKEGLTRKTSAMKRANLQHFIYSFHSVYNPSLGDHGNGHVHTLAESEGVLLHHCHGDQHRLVDRYDSSCNKRSHDMMRWGDEELTALKALCVTGSWGDDDAAIQLQCSSDDDHDDDVTMETDSDELVAKKQKLKAQFNEEYDKGQSDEQDYFSEMKQKLAAQAELNKSIFEGVDDELRWQLEGFPAGCYVRMEIKGIPCELLEKFDPQQPLIIGGLSPSEEQLSFLQVGGAGLHV